MFSGIIITSPTFRRRHTSFSCSCAKISVKPIPNLPFNPMQTPKWVRHFSAERMADLKPSAGRGLLRVRLDVCGKPVTIGTTHFESPCNGRTYTRQRAEQCWMATNHLDIYELKNAIFCGDMNWIEADGPMHLPAGAPTRRTHNGCGDRAVQVGWMLGCICIQIGRGRHSIR